MSRPFKAPQNAINDVVPAMCQKTQRKRPQKWGFDGVGRWLNWGEDFGGSDCEVQAFV